ncbi:MAG: hypothetical protein ACRDTT_23120, partial [Pseudonocardiaceae bacterium]
SSVPSIAVSASTSAALSTTINGGTGGEVIAHLMRRTARQAGLHLSVRELLAQLAGIQETVLLYPGKRGRPKARRMITDRTDLQQQLYDLYELTRGAPVS